MCVNPLEELNLEEVWIISDGVEDTVLHGPYNAWKVDSVILYPIIKTMIRVPTEIRGLRIQAAVTEALEVALDYAMNRTLNFEFLVRFPAILY